MTSEEKNKYDRENYVQFKLKYNKKKDADIIEYLRGLKNKQGALREIIREKIKENCEKGIDTPIE